VTETNLPSQGLVLWPVGTGDSATLVVTDKIVVQIDLHDMAMADAPDALVAAVADRLVEVLPKTSDDQPYLAAFILSHADKDHCLGFADLLSKVTIGEIWATPRLWREFADAEEALCPDAEAFHQEAKRRVAATLKAIDEKSVPRSGDRIRIVGSDHDSLDHDYAKLPRSYVSYPGESVTTIDGVDVSAWFDAFLHAPFKDDCAAERNETSLALQVTLRDAAGNEGHVLLLGDLAYETITKIFDYSEGAGRPERLTWEVLLAPHHCSKKVMYVSEDGKEVLKQDILHKFDAHAAGSATVVVSSGPFRDSDEPGDNPPHLLARKAYEQIADLIVTAEYPTTDAPTPIVFGVGADGFELLAIADTTSEAAEVAKAVVVGAGLVGAGVILYRLGQTISKRLADRRRTKGDGLARARAGVATARGDSTPPRQPVGFGAP